MEMANEFQKQSLRRKFIYLGLIAALFCATLLVRSLDKLNPYCINKQAEQLELREESLGEVDLKDKALRLVLTGSRGLTICVLWYNARDKQDKHEFNQAEMLIRTVMKLQPHFATPWLYQSWNLAFNVPTELRGVKDKYFYISRGINLLGQGERINHDNCEMRFFTGFYTQQKIGISDEQNTLRCLYQMSCIDPSERDAGRFRRAVNGTTTVDLDQFEDFCRKHPFLVRRLHDHLRCKKPDDVIDFLAANHKIPGRYEDRPATFDAEQTAAAYKPLDERFPTLPPAQNFDRDELTYDSNLGDDFDNYAAARAWYGYAQDPIEAGIRIPKNMMTIIFESYPARAQAYVGERLEAEGWFDTDGWHVKDLFPSGRSGTDHSRVVRLGTERHWAQEAWEKAFQMYERFGTTKGLLKTKEEEEAMTDADREAFVRGREVTNFVRHYHKAKVERTKEAVTARKLFFQADELRLAGLREQALEMYERPDAFPTWRKILLDEPDFRDDLDAQEEAYVMHRKWLSLVKDKREKVLRQMLLVEDWLAQGASGGTPTTRMVWPSLYMIQVLRTPIRGPFDYLTSNKQPLISERAVESALGHYNLSRDPDHPTPPQALRDIYKAPTKPVRQRNVIIGGP
jgi:hypothetical protein